MELDASVRSLSRQAFDLLDAGRPDEALAAAEEAVAIGRGLLVAGHVDVDVSLSRAMRNLMNAARQANRPDAAMAAVRQVCDAFRHLATADSEPVFARHLHTYASALRPIDPPAAVSLAEESAAIARRGDAGYALDTSLRCLQACLEAAGFTDRARAVHRELYASLTPDSPVEEADITIRTYNILKRLACHRLRDVALLSVRDLVYLPWPVRWMVEEIEEKLALVGLGPLQPGEPPDEPGVPDLPDETFGALCVRCGDADAVAQIHHAVVAAYAADGVRPLDAEAHLALFGDNGLDRAQEVNSASTLGSDLVLIVPESGAWVGVHSARWQLTPQGRHPLAQRLSTRWPVLSLTATAGTAYEVCRYHNGVLVQYAAHGRPAGFAGPAGPAPVAAGLDFERLAEESWMPTSASELRAAFGDPHVFGNIVGLPSTGIADLLEGWPVYDPDEAGDSAVFLWRD